MKAAQKCERNPLKALRGANRDKKDKVEEKVVSSKLTLFTSIGICVTVIGNYMKKEWLRIIKGVLNLVSNTHINICTSI